MSPKRKEGPKLSDTLRGAFSTQCQPGTGLWAYEGGRGGDPSDWEMVVGSWDSSPCGGAWGVVVVQSHSFSLLPLLGWWVGF